MATVVIHHTVTTGAAADPNALVDGPAWDAAHTVTGLENVPNVDTTNASNLTSGTVPAAQMPALTGDVTTSAGAVATTIGANKVTNAKAAQMAAWTFKGNVTASLANATDFTIHGLTTKASPVGSDEIIIWDVAGSAIKKATLTSIPAGAGTVTSVATGVGLTGGPITTSGTAALDPAYLRGYISGLTLSNDGVSPLTVIDIAAGVATADDQSAIMKLASAYTKTFSAWTVGTGVGGLDTGSVASNVDYHLFAIQRSDTGVVDVLLSRSATAPTMPTNYDRKRRLGAILTTGTNIRGFVQLGNEFLLKASVLDVSGSGMSVTAGNAQLTVPNGVSVKAKMIARNNGGVATLRLWIYSPQVTDEAASSTNALSVLSSTTAILTPVEAWTDTTRNVRVVADVATGTYDIRTYGWTDLI